MSEYIPEAAPEAAATGDATAPDTIHPMAVDVTERPAMTFNDQTRLAKDPNTALRPMWDQLAS